uniref:ATP synthase F(1) complex subunit delta, mitochondrial n=1 Tax=Sarcophilus harrisii TaxID=9305 RepID=G3VFV0_SARHA
ASSLRLPGGSPLIPTARIGTRTISKEKREADRWVYFNEANVKQVDVPTQSGAFGILAAHVPTLQVLKPGVVTVHAEDGTTTKYFVSSGSVTVNADSSVQLLAEEAVALDMLDLAAAKSNLEKAHSELSGVSDEAARAEVQIRIEANEAIVKALES